MPRQRSLTRSPRSARRFGRKAWRKLEMGFPFSRLGEDASPHEWERSRFTTAACSATRCYPPEGSAAWAFSLTGCSASGDAASAACVHGTLLGKAGSGGRAGKCWGNGGNYGLNGGGGGGRMGTSLAAVPVEDEGFGDIRDGSYTVHFWFSRERMGGP